MKFLSLIVTLLGLAIVSPSYAVDNKSAMASSMNKAEVININKANIDQLITLPGIGKSKAQAIVDFRDKQGAFKSVAELAQVKGIGDKLLAKLEGKVVL
ncbi:ComEA family DNA-binding protein [Pseudoalteromonas sp. H105]|jgi:competence protein ComEA|uniref:ComEA family DNA-binding protein n=1 Tax=Pseudoalteromonas sp. H105 TaxID=1348393 RepID=UPI000732070F|nr:helix-hairpin-helix domain-containing protein [Pseudoalteromonas sp. H105]KTF16212.1 competence protein [Pseudoalteromonas sp. H105]